MSLNRSGKTCKQNSLTYLRIFGCDILFISCTSRNMFGLLLNDVFIFNTITWSVVRCVTWKNKINRMVKNKNPCVFMSQQLHWLHRYLRLSQKNSYLLHPSSLWLTTFTWDGSKHLSSTQPILSSMVCKVPHNTAQVPLLPVQPKTSSVTDLSMTASNLIPLTLFLPAWPSNTVHSK